MKKFFALLSILLIFSGGGNLLYAQDVTVTGSVKDAHGNPVVGASVVVEGTSIGISTAFDGTFSIKAPANGKLAISYLGYEPQTVSINNRTAIDIILKEDTTQISDVVVVGFGTQTRTAITDAVSTVDTKLLASRPVTTLGQSLQGTVPGLNLSVNDYGGELGQTMNVNIRGTGTISTGSSASTLILIDGIEGNMNNLNPDDIESISVLKDASASAIYGSRAAFGVILITTKKGNIGAPSVSYSGNFRYYGPNNLPDLMNSWNFANYFNEASVNDGGGVIFNEDTMNRIQQYMRGEIKTSTIPNANGMWQFHQLANDNVDWYDVHYKWSWAQEHNFNINGGSEKMQYYASANYLDQDGNLRYGEDTYERLMVSGKFNAKPYKWLDIEMSTRYVNFTLDNPLYTDMGGLLYHDIVRMWPMMPFKDPNGHYMRNGKLNQLTSGSRAITENTNVYVQGQLVFHPLKDWNITASAGIRTINEFKHSNLNKLYEYNVNNEPVLLNYNDSYPGGQTAAFQTWTRASHVTTSVTTDYTFSINKHNVKIMAGFNAEKYKNRYLSVERPDLITDNVPEIGAATGEDKINSATAYEWATAGFFGRLNYDYNNKYFLQGVIRYDGSSRFLRDNRWGLFGSVSAGWNIAAESFLADHSDIISVLKPSISWGTLGNQNTSSYYPMYLTQAVSVNGGNWVMNGTKPTTASAPGVIPSTLTWETVQSLNVGLDVSMFRNRLSVDFDYFVRKTLDMLGPAAEIASIFGTGLPNTNNTNLRTKGWELAVNWRDRVGQVGYNVGINISDSRSFVDKYPNASKSLGAPYYEGQELGEIWGYVTHGIAKSQEEMDAWLEGNNPSWGSGWGEGDIMYTDLNGDGVINTGANTLSDPGDRKILGNNRPRYRFGITMGLDWKGIDFSMFWQGVAKRDVALGGPLFWGMAGNMWQSTGLNEHLDYYRPEDTQSVFGPNTDAYFPKIYMNKTMNMQTQSRYIQNGAYLRLKNIQLGYSFPETWLKKAYIQRLRVFVSIENAWTISGLPDAFDPEATGGPMGNGKTYPLQTTVSFGVNVTF